jgi:hypothetical protein
MVQQEKRNPAVNSVWTFLSKTPLPLGAFKTNKSNRGIASGQNNYARKQHIKQEII